MVRLMPLFATRFYEHLIRTAEPRVPQRFRPLWEHPAGPKTVFFWSPFAKWLLVIAGLGDLSRPADKLSLRQNLALCLTGFIWSRYSLIIIPKNYSLFAVNFFTGLTGSMQLSRIIHHETVVKHEVHLIEEILEDPNHSEFEIIEKEQPSKKQPKNKS